MTDEPFFTLFVPPGLIVSWAVTPITSEVLVAGASEPLPPKRARTVALYWIPLAGVRVATPAEFVTAVPNCVHCGLYALVPSKMIVWPPLPLPERVAVNVIDVPGFTS